MMPLAEVFVIEVGSSIAKSIFKLWVKDSNLAQDVSSDIIELIKARITNTLDQRRAQRQFETIGEMVGEDLLEICRMEGTSLEEESHVAVARGVAETLKKSKISSELLVSLDLDAKMLANYLKTIDPAIIKLFSSNEVALYQRIIDESSVCIIKIASQLPVFTENTLSEVLKREKYILGITNDVLREIRQVREHLNSLDPSTQTVYFEGEYRRAIIEKLDTLELFGTDVSSKSRRQTLSVAYIAPLVLQKNLASSNKSDQKFDNDYAEFDQPFFEHNRETLTTEEQDTKVNVSAKRFENDSSAINQNLIPIDEALNGSQKLLIRGVAGLGKTTLLQWIAVRSASRSFTGLLTTWDHLVPFYIRLRQYINSELPPPENFPKLVAPAIAGIMPKGWVHEKLGLGHALVLIDGLDEVPSLQRQDVREWLKDLVRTYPKSRFIVTSRPHAAEEGWLDDSEFNNIELQPMKLSDIHTFIDKWHAALMEIHDTEDKSYLSSLAEQLKEEVRTDRSKRNLATNPLLCAMLCALNRDRRQHLPSDRIELYEACCRLLIERRDKERRISLIDYPALVLTYRQKRALLEGIAYWMLRNNRSEVDLYSADERFAWKLTNMHSVPPQITGADVRQLLVERTSILREPVLGWIEFTHRSFQEFLAAYAVVEEDDVNMLVEHAYDEHWWGTISLAAGLASKKVREYIIHSLLVKGDKNSKFRYQVHLLAVSCMETSVELGQKVRKEVEERINNLIPPKDMSDATALAFAGDLAVPFLSYKEENRQDTCVRALALIGTKDALDVLEDYCYDMRLTTINELWRGWDSFDRKDYAQRIIIHLVQNNRRLPQEHIRTLNGFQYLAHIASLNLANCKLIKDLTPLANLDQLEHLDLSNCELIYDLAPLANLSQLKSLSLSRCVLVQSLQFLTKLAELTSLNLSECKQVHDLSPLANLKLLTTLDLSGCELIVKLAPLYALIQLRSLNLLGCTKISDLSPLANLTQLTSLNLSGCTKISDLSPLTNLTQLTSLNLSGCTKISDLSPLTNLTQLTSLNLSYCTQVGNIAPLANLTRLTSLNLSYCRPVRDFTPVNQLRQLEQLSLVGCDHIDDLSLQPTSTKLNIER